MNARDRLFLEQSGKLAGDNAPAGAPQRNYPAPQPSSGGSNLNRFPGKALRPQPSLPMHETNSYPLVLTVNQQLTTASGSVLIVQQPAVARNFLQIRNAHTSTGDLLVAFGQQATDSTCFLRLPADGMVIYDFKIPQNDIFVAAASGTVIAIIGYADLISL